MSQSETQYLSDIYEEADQDNYFSDSTEDFDFIQSNEADNVFSCKINSQNLYTILDLDSIEKKKNNDVAQISVLTELEFPIAQLLLQSFSWNQESIFEKFIDAPEKVAKELGLVLNQDNILIKNVENFVCPILREEGTLETFALSCGHRYCIGCYRRYLVEKIKENHICIQCPEFNCNILLSYKDIEVLVDVSDYLLYKQKVLLDYVNSAPSLKWCPAPDCQYAIECSVTSSSLSHTIPTIKCKCEHSFCFRCGKPGHSPALCEMCRLWDEKCQNDSETRNWIVSFTKECPKCKATIEKNGGCNHMSCVKCKFEFCWICLGGWNLHQNNYKCNIYKKSNEDDSAISSKASLDRYLHHYTRFNNHAQSIKLTGQLLLKADQNISSVQRKTSLSWIELHFLHNAVTTLANARTVLQWTYVFAFFLKRNNNSIIFEDNQSDLESAVEQLNSIIEKTIDSESIEEIKKTVLNLSSYVSKRQQVLIEDVLSGYADNRWEFIERLKR
ncbi:hypothetical protein BB561_001921 [Smittium simulii]|uniref:RBR-type E3 ubiquitin transferase n=1 Tax=Smittium simulii TaxID=133385 RepID=A0A2T9YSG3_9FUNG|nr:hypothetical protein BB561_001921 [Smittium simulii]